MESKRAPVQGWAAGIPWDLHLEAYSAYCKRYGPQKALIDGGCRGGFHTNELDVFLPGWREKVSALGIAEARIRELETENAALRHDLDRSMARVVSMLNPDELTCEHGKLLKLECPQCDASAKVPTP